MYRWFAFVVGLAVTAYLMLCAFVCSSCYDGLHDVLYIYYMVGI